MADRKNLQPPTDETSEEHKKRFRALLMGPVPFDEALARILKAPPQHVPAPKPKKPKAKKV